MELATSLNLPVYEESLKNVRSKISSKTFNMDLEHMRERVDKAFTCSFK